MLFGPSVSPASLIPREPHRPGTNIKDPKPEQQDGCVGRGEEGLVSCFGYLNVVLVSHFDIRFSCLQRICGGLSTHAPKAYVDTHHPQPA